MFYVALVFIALVSAVIKLPALIERAANWDRARLKQPPTAPD